MEFDVERFSECFSIVGLIYITFIMPQCYFEDFPKLSECIHLFL